MPYARCMTLGYALDANYASLFDGTNENEHGSHLVDAEHSRVDGQGGYLDQWFAPVTAP